MNRRLIVAIFAGLFLLFIGFPTLIGIATDWWWFQAIGYQSVFVKQTVAETSLGIGIGTFAFAFFYANLGAGLPYIYKFAESSTPGSITPEVRANTKPLQSVFLYAKRDGKRVSLSGFLTIK